jgi:glycosyltransferase involved in cell wall biosynthesis
MRIGIDARMVDYRQAGITQYTLQLMQALAQRNTEDEFILLSSRRRREPLVTREGFSQRRLLTPPHHTLEQFTLPLEISPLGLDVLHSPDFIPPFRRNCRSVITIHDLNFVLFPHFLTKSSARYYGQIDEAVRRTDAIIAVSQATKEDVMRLLGVPEHRIKVIYEAASPVFRRLEDSDIPERVRQRFGVEQEFLLFVSTVEPRKNVPTLLKAFKRLLTSYRPDTLLVLAGERGWLYEEVFQLVTDLDLVDRVRFVGRVTTEELVWLYNTAQALVAPSFYEGFGLTPLEAMACGTPVIVSDISSFPEVVGDAGLLIDPYEEEELAVAMWRILSDQELRASLVEKGFTRAGLFSWEKAARETLDLYHSLA